MLALRHLLAATLNPLLPVAALALLLCPCAQDDYLPEISPFFEDGCKLLISTVRRNQPLYAALNASARDHTPSYSSYPYSTKMVITKLCFVWWRALSGIREGLVYK